MKARWGKKKKKRGKEEEKGGGKGGIASLGVKGRYGFARRQISIPNPRRGYIMHNRMQARRSLRIAKLSSCWKPWKGRHNDNPAPCGARDTE